MSLEIIFLLTQRVLGHFREIEVSLKAYQKTCSLKGLHTKTVKAFVVPLQFFSNPFIRDCLLIRKNYKAF